jgi:hypothetical protein
MFQISPSGLILIGLVLVVTGVILPLLMVVQVLPSTFFLNFFAYGASLTGLFLGVIGAASYMRDRRK